MILNNLIKLCIVWTAPLSMIIITGLYTIIPISNRIFDLLPTFVKDYYIKNIYKTT